MNDFEERLRVLLNEQVDARVDPQGPVPEFTNTPVVRNRDRRTRPAWMLPLLAAACVLVVGGGALGATRLLATPDHRRHTVASNPSTSAAVPSPTAVPTPVVPTPTPSHSKSVHSVPAGSTVHRPHSTARRAGNPAPHPASSSTAPASPTTSATSSAPPLAPCDGANLAVTDPHAITTPTDGQAYVIFQNTASYACTLKGTPAVVLVDAAGADGGTATATGNVTDQSTAGPAPLVTLQPDGYAAASIHWLSPDYSAPAGTCPDFPQLRVTAPDTATSGTATASEVMHVCPSSTGGTSLTVDEIVSGYPW